MNRPQRIFHREKEHNNNGAVEQASEGKASLITTIESDAQAEEAKFLQDAAEQASQREQYTDKKIEMMLNETRQKAQAQGEIIRSKAISQAELEIRRQELRARNEIIRQIMTRVEEKLNSLIHSDNYREALIHWIVEAALGLGSDSVRLNTSAEERGLVDESLLNEVKTKVQQARARPLTIRLTNGPAPASQGILLTTEDGRMAYNNQVKTRLLRRQRDIQRLIHDTLFSEEQQKNHE